MQKQTTDYEKERGKKVEKTAIVYPFSMDNSLQHSTDGGCKCHCNCNCQCEKGM